MWRLLPVLKQHLANFPLVRTPTFNISPQTLYHHEVPLSIITSDGHQAMGARSNVHTTTNSPSPGPLRHGLPDVASLGYILSDMGCKERRRYVRAHRLDRIFSRSALSESQPNTDFAGAWCAYRNRWDRPGLADGLRKLTTKIVELISEIFGASRRYNTPTLTHVSS